MAIYKQSQVLLCALIAQQVDESRKLVLMNRSVCHLRIWILFTIALATEAEWHK